MAREMQRRSMILGCLTTGMAFFFGLLAIMSSQPAAAADWTVTNTNDNGPGSLRAVIAMATDGDVINFDSSLNGQTIILTSGSLLVVNDLLISGPGAGLLAISGNSNSGIFYISAKVTISGLTMKDAGFGSSLTAVSNASDLELRDSAIIDSGRAIDNFGSMRIENSVVADNFSSIGGAINNIGAMDVISSVISGNSGISTTYGGIYNRGEMTMVGTTVSGNTTSNYSGPFTVAAGGILNEGFLSLENSRVVSNTTGSGIATLPVAAGIANRRVMTVYDSIIAGNTLDLTDALHYSVGGLMLYSATTTIAGSTIADNSAGDSGDHASGGIGVIRGSLSLTDSIVSGNSAGMDGFYNGGGISIFEARASVAASTVSENSARAGGGIRSSDSNLSLRHVKVISNSGGSSGGINYYFYGAITITESIISHNHSDYCGGLGGPTHDLLVERTVIADNSAAVGGGGVCNGSSTTLRMIDSSIVDNVAGEYGGGINNAPFGQLYLDGVTVSGNEAGGVGGGISSSFYSSMYLTNSTVSDNRAGEGGGLAIFGWARLTNSTIAFNTAGMTGGGMWLGDDSSVTVSGSIVSGNWDTAGENDCTAGAGELLSEGYNLVTSPANSCLFSGPGDLTAVDPLLASLADNGGDTWTHALISGSPAVDAIPPAVNGCGTTIITDQRGALRPWDGDADGSALCDIGAYELERYLLLLPVVLKNE